MHNSQLARIAVTDETGATLLDELVVPELAVTDYLTVYSGITPALLAGATATAADVRRRLRELIGEVEETCAMHRQPPPPIHV